MILIMHAELCVIFIKLLIFKSRMLFKGKRSTGSDMMVLFCMFKVWESKRRFLFSHWVVFWSQSLSNILLQVLLELMGASMGRLVHIRLKFVFIMIRAGVRLRWIWGLMTCEGVTVRAYRGYESAFLLQLEFSFQVLYGFQVLLPLEL